MQDTDDIILEENADDEGASAEELVQKIKKLKAELAKSTKEKQEYLDGWQRAKADYVNVKRRADEDRQNLVLQASAALVEALLPALDSFEHALAAPSTDTGWIDGIKNTYAQLMKALSSEGVASFDPLNEHFDPNRHEPVGTVAVGTETEDNTVTTVHQRGYTLHGKVIRPARVTVGHYQKE